ncbi:MAG: hypothetical protein MK077_01715 [Phycisphaerales bacterium]|nr:hypothetical protein [Phycisphaerales bacterium]
MSVRAKLLVAAITAGLLAAVSVLVGAVMVVQAFDLMSIVVKGSTTFTVETTGQWLVASETKAPIDGVEHSSSSVTRDQVLLHDPLGQEHALNVTQQQASYQMPGRQGEVIGSFSAEMPGQWQVEVPSETAPVLLAFGADPIDRMTWWLLGSGAVAIGLLGIAAGCGWVAWRRPTGVHSLHESSRPSAR